MQATDGARKDRTRQVILLEVGGYAVLRQFLTAVSLHEHSTIIDVSPRYDEEHSSYSSLRDLHDVYLMYDLRTEGSVAHQTPVVARVYNRSARFVNR